MSPGSIDLGRWAEVYEITQRAAVRSLRYSMHAMSGGRAQEFRDRSLPDVPWPGFSGAYAAIDELMLMYFAIGRSSLDSSDFGRIEREVEDLIVHHDHRGVTDDPFSHHDDPPAPSRFEIVPREIAGFDAEWMTFPSEWEPHQKAPGRTRWLEDGHNRDVHVGLFRHDDGPRPWLVMIHGAEMGRAQLDARIFRAEHLHKTLGVNVAMPVLPKHGRRGSDESAVRGTFPSMEMADNIHGLSQGIWDVRRVLTWIRTQEPTAIGVYGFSLGGYVASLLGGFEPTLDALVLGCPVVDLVDLYVANGLRSQSANDHLASIYERARTAHRPIDPLGFECVVPRDRIMMMGAVADRLSDPVSQLSRLWHHWDQPHLEWVDGGHVTFFLKSEPMDRLADFMRERGVVADEALALAG